MVVVVAVFVVLQATNSAAVSVMSVFVTQTLGLDVAWAGIALGVAAALEIPGPPADRTAQPARLQPDADRCRVPRRHRLLRRDGDGRRSGHARSASRC